MQKGYSIKNTNNIPLTLDLYEPNKIISKGSPVILYIHGGSWAYGDTSLPPIFTPPFLDSFRQADYSIISVKYELLDESLDFNKQVSDIKDSLNFLVTLNTLLTFLDLQIYQH